MEKILQDSDTVVNKILKTYIQMIFNILIFFGVRKIL